MGRGKSCAALAAGARSTHYVQLRVEIAGKESNKQEGREEVYSKKRKQMNNPATRSRQEWRSNGRRRTQHTLRIYIQLRVEIAVKESNKWYLLSATPEYWWGRKQKSTARRSSSGMLNSIKK